MNNDNTKESEEKEMGRILVVEDDTFLVDLLAKNLTSSGFKCLYAMNTNLAKSLLENNKVDLILMDIVMPGGSGLTLLKELKVDDRFKSIPVVMISNLGQSEEIDQGMKAGAVEYLVKSNVIPAEIVAKIQKILSK